MHGDLFADIIDSRSTPPIYHVIIQRFGSPEILGWTQERSFGAAQNAAESYLGELSRKERTS